MGERRCIDIEALFDVVAVRDIAVDHDVTLTLGGLHCGLGPLLALPTTTAASQQHGHSDHADGYLQGPVLAHDGVAAFRAFSAFSALPACQLL